MKNFLYHFTQRIFYINIFFGKIFCIGWNIFKYKKIFYKLKIISFYKKKFYSSLFCSELDPYLTNFFALSESNIFKVFYFLFFLTNFHKRLANIQVLFSLCYGQFSFSNFFCYSKKIANSLPLLVCCCHLSRLSLSSTS